MANPAATVVAAGFIIFRRFTTAPEYLLLQTSYGKHHWTPPKGYEISSVVKYAELIVVEI